MIVAVGSTNPTKLQAARTACQDVGIVIEKIQGFEVESGVTVQPFTDEETRIGSLNRARHALKLLPHADLAIGLEGGVYETPEGLMNVVWCSVVDAKDFQVSVSGARFLLPTIIAEPLRKGAELGPLLDTLFKTQDIKKKQGLIGVVTANTITRAEEYGSIAKLALGLWIGRDWQEQLGK